MEADPGTTLDDQLCFALYAASRAFTRAYAPVLSELGLTYPQYVTLLALWEQDAPVPVSAVGARLHLDSGTLTPLLKRLEQMGLVHRQRDRVDERRVLISASAEGLRLRERAQSVPRRMAERLPVGDASLAPLRDELRRLLLVLEQA